MIISKDFHFEAAHMLSNYGGPCANLHGHSYTGVVYIDSPTTISGHMVLDFNRIKDVVNAYDHRIIFSSPEERDVAETALYKWAITYDMAHKDMDDGRKGTAEDMSKQLAEEVIDALPHGTKVRVTLKETASSEVDTGWVSK